MLKVLEVFWRFLCLGCISFGGPAAHIGYFHTSFVQKLAWIDEASYARLVAFSQFLPGPGSSQIGFALGLRKAGILGGVAAFIGFTLPSFILLYALAIYQPDDIANNLFSGVVDGLKLLAVVIVADACYKMFKAFCVDKVSTAIAIGACIIILLFPSLLSQILVLLTGGLLGFFFLSHLVSDSPKSQTNNRSPNWPALIVFSILLVGLPFLSSDIRLVELFSDFYQAGSLVFGGGHVVVPLLNQTVGDALTNDQFLSGYASAQAVPGPMFSLAAYFGAQIITDQPLIGALVATLAIFLPGFLLVLSLHDSWQSLASRAWVAGSTSGINATVVGLLLAALYQPVFVSAVTAPIDIALVIVGLFLLNVLRLPILLLVIGFIAAGMLSHLVG